MARTFVPITIEQLKEKIFLVLHKDDGVIEEKSGKEIKTWEDLYEKPFGNASPDLGYYALRGMARLTPTVEKDLAKVQFDLENTLGPGDLRDKNDPPAGFHTLDNGLTFFGMAAGGDWEHPLFFIIYYDGSKLRGYIPEDGNPWNTDTKQAYGNDENADKINIKKRYPESDIDYTIYEGMLWDRDKIIADIKARILPKEVEPKMESTIKAFPISDELNFPTDKR